MAYAHDQSSLQVEIQTLRDALATSEKKAIRYAQTIANLTVELEDLRNSICHSCKKKLVSCATSLPSVTISATQGNSTHTATSVSASSLGRQRSSSSLATDNGPSIGPSRSLIASPNTNTPLPVPSDSAIAHYCHSSETTPTSTRPRSDENIISPEQKFNPPNWSVVYNPKVERTLDVDLAHAFTYDSSVYCVKMSPDGQRLAVGLQGNGKTCLYELQTGSNIRVFVDRYVKRGIYINSVQFSPNGQLLAAGASDGQIRIWDITIKRMRTMLKGHRLPVNSIDFSPNGCSLVSGSYDRSVCIWNIRDGSSKILLVTGSSECFVSVVFSPDGRYIAAGNLDKSLWIWDSRTYRLVAKWWGHTSDVWSTVFTPDGKGLMSGGYDDTVKYWDVSSLGNRSTASVVNEGGGFPLVRSFLGHRDCVNSIAPFPGNTQWIATGSDDTSVRVWDTESGVCQLTLKWHTDEVLGVDVSRTQNFLATAGRDGHVTVWKYTQL